MAEFSSGFNRSFPWKTPSGTKSLNFALVDVLLGYREHLSTCRDITKVAPNERGYDDSAEPESKI